MRLVDVVPLGACGALTVGALALLVGRPAPASGSVGRPTDLARARDVHEARADFHEDEDPSRVVASLGATLTRTSRGARLDVTASALGARVVPPPGFEGVAGGNEIAARELRSLLEGERCVVRVLRGGAVAGHGHARAGRVDRVPTRRLAADGTVREGPRPGEVGPVEAAFVAVIRGDGEAVVEVVVDGKVRVRAVCRVRADALRIVSLASVAAHPARVGAP
jgi:hypothetical protein